ncbi:hypothetical protein HAX54_030285, partial [Datura stramonium]|nr:hypothetical protein [Datura stramonium]
WIDEELVGRKQETGVWRPVKCGVLKHKTRTNAREKKQSWSKSERTWRHHETPVTIQGANGC